MPVPAPPIYTDDVAEKTARLLERYVGFRPARGDLAAGLVDAFARLGEIAAERLNRVPDKSFLAFLDLVGIRLRPPQPARAPLTFRLAAGAPGAVVPARTPVAARPLEGETVPVVFETEEELVVTAARLGAVLAREPARDAYADLGSLATGAAGHASRVFEGTTPIDHRLYVGISPLAAPGTGKTLQLRLAGGLPSWLQLLAWERWDGDAWSPVTSVAVSGDSLTLAGLPPVPPVTVAGRSSSFVRARLGTPVPGGAVTGAAGAAKTLTATGLAADAAWADDVELEPGAPFEPFVRTNDGTFFLAVDDAFAKAGAAVRLRATLDPRRTPAASAPLKLHWAFSSAGGWTEIGVSGPLSTRVSGDASFSDGTHALTDSGVVAFTCPGGWTPAAVRGDTRRWLRVSMADGSYDADALPLVRSLTVEYDWALPRIDSISASVTVARTGLAPEAAFANQQAVDLNRDFLPFGERPRPNDVLYLALDEAFVPGTAVTLHVDLTSPPGTAGPPSPAASTSVLLRWEYWDGTSWATLGESGPGRDPSVTLSGGTAGPQPTGSGGGTFADGTNAFLVSGQTVAFTVPAKLSLVEVNGQRHRWIRARIARGDYGTEATYTPSSTPPGFTFTGSTLKPPSIRSLKIDAQRSTPPAGPAAVVTENGFVFTPQTGAGGFDPFLPSADTRPTLYLGFDRPLPNATIRLFFGIPAVELAGALGADVEPAAVAWEFWDAHDRAWSSLETSDETRAFTRAGLVTFIAPSGLQVSTQLGRAAHWLRARWDRGDYLAPPAVERIATNTIWAEQATSIQNEVVGSSTGERDQTFLLARAPVLPGQVLEVRESAAAGEERWVEWDEVVDFYGSDPDSRHYVLDRQSGEIRFGDGRHGAAPPQGLGNVRMRAYRTGGGARGNRAAGTITQLRSTVPYVDAVTNVEAADGGGDAETPADVRERGPRSLRHGGRAVAIEDFEDLAREVSAEIARVHAIPVLGDDPSGAVGLIVVPRSEARRPAPSVQLVALVRDEIAARITPTFDFWVGGPGWLKVGVTAEIVPVSLDAATDVESAVRTRLDRFLHPLTGGFDGLGWPFGRRPHRSDLHAWLEATAGVDHVRTLLVTESQTAEERPPVPGAFLVYSGEHDVTMAGGE